MQYQHLIQEAIRNVNKHKSAILYYRNTSNVKANSLFVPPVIENELKTLLSYVNNKPTKEIIFNSVYTYLSDFFKLKNGDTIRNTNGQLVCIYYKNDFANTHTVFKVIYTLHDNIAIIPDNVRFKFNLPLTYWD